MPQVGIQDHIADLKQELAFAESCIASDVIASDVRHTVQSRFKQDLKGQLELLERLSKEIGGRHRAAESWRKLSQIRRESRDLLQECLAFLHGALFRSAQMDRGICAIADAFLARLAGDSDIEWSRLTMMGDAEDIADRTDIVRIRFPDFSVWSLPILVHEFGHLVASDLNVKKRGRRSFPVQTFIDKQGPELSSQAGELFADLYATYAAGPALAMAGVLLRFDPSSPFRGNDSHPASAERVRFMTQALRRIDPSYADISASLVDEWHEAIEASGAGGSLAPATEIRLDGWLNQLLGMLTLHLPESRYTSWARVVGLVNAGFLTWDSAAETPDDLSLIDVINAAWLARLRRPADADGISERALALCTALIAENHR